MADRGTAAWAGLLVVPFLMGAAVAPVDEAQVVLTFADPEIVESSGLVVVDGLVVTTNDSGSSGRVYAVDPATGETIGTTDWDADPLDVEALAPGPGGSVWVADIGDNTASRSSITVSAVRVGRGSGAVSTPAYELVYPDGPHDAETLMSDPSTGRLFVATKEPFGGALYAAPETLAEGVPNRLEQVGDVLPIATDGAFLPDGRHLVVRNYGTAALYAFPSMERVGRFALPAQPQGEGLAVEPDGALLLGSEGRGSEVLRVELPSDLAAEVAGSATAKPSRAPTESREDRELPETTETTRSGWPWFLTGLIGLGFIVVLTWSLRRR